MPTMTVGVLAAHDDAKDLAGRLTAALGRRYENVEWHVRDAEADPADPAADERELVEATRRRALDEGWELAIGLTDLRSASTAARCEPRAVAGMSHAALGALGPPHSRSRRRTLRNPTLLPFGLTIGVALAGCGDSDSERRDAMATAGKVEGFVLTKSDLPSGYALEGTSRASSRSSCLEGRERSVRRKLASLGLQRCAEATFRKDVDLGGGDGLVDAPDSDALLMRTETAASHALRSAERRSSVSAGPSATLIPWRRQGSETRRHEESRLTSATERYSSTPGGGDESWPRCHRRARWRLRPAQNAGARAQSRRSRRGLRSAGPAIGASRWTRRLSARTVSTPSGGL